MLFNGEQNQIRNKSDEWKLEYDLQVHKELSELYEMITKLTLVCIKRGIRLIIENPYNTQHYLTRYWAIKPKVIDLNRKLKGDYFKKPTQYWFINCEPCENVIFEPMETKNLGVYDEIATGWHRTVERSMISPEYANRFIREEILGDERKTEIKDEQMMIEF